MTKGFLTHLFSFILLSLSAQWSYAQVIPSNQPCDAPSIAASNTTGVCIDYPIEVCCGAANYNNFLGKQPVCGVSPINKDAWVKLTNVTAGEAYNFIYTERGKFRSTWVEVMELPAGKDCSDPSAYASIVCTRENDVQVFENATCTATFTPPNATSTYYIRMMRYNTLFDNNLEGKICVAKAYPNDEPCGAILLPVQPKQGTNPVMGQNYYAADWQPNIYFGPTCGPNNDVWYKFVPVECSVNILLKNLTPTSYEIQAAILESSDGTCKNLKEVTPCGGVKNKFDDILLSADGLVVGRTYYVIVDGFAPPYFNATGMHSIEVFAKSNPPACPNIETPCDCTKPGCLNPVPLANSTVGNAALNLAKNNDKAAGCIDLTAQNIPVLGGTNRAEFCASYTAQSGDELMAFDNVVHKDAACESLNISTNAVYVDGDCAKPIAPVCLDRNGVSPVYQLTAGTTYKFCRQTVADGGDPDCVGKIYTGFCAFLWRIQNRYDLNATICNGENYKLGTKVFTQSGTYTEALKSATGCDSIVTLTLTVLAPSSRTIDAKICTGKGYVLNSVTYTETGTYTAKLKDKNGCDSTVTLNLTKLAPIAPTAASRTICNGENYILGTKKLDKSGIYTETIPSVNGCDSTVTLTLTVLPKNETIIKKVVCYATTFTYKGKVYDKTGQYIVATLKDTKGCDSTELLDFTVLPDYSDLKIERAICPNASYDFGGEILTTAGTYKKAFKSKYLGLQCDSMVSLTLKVQSKLETNLKETLCFGGTVKIGTKTFDKTGTFVETLKSKGGCDSVVTLNLIVFGKAIEETKSFTICDKPITIDGINYSKDTSFVKNYKFKNSNCDSAKISFSVSINRPNNTVKMGTICGDKSFTFEGKTYDKEGTYLDTIYTDATKKCIKEFVTITVSKASSVDATIDTKSSVCDPAKCTGSATVLGKNGEAPFTYKWNNGNTTNTIDKICKGNYIVTITDNRGCSIEKTVGVGIETAKFSLTTTPSLDSFVLGQTKIVNVTVIPPTNLKFLWTPNEGVQLTTQTGATTTFNITPKTTTTYTVTATDSDGCTATSATTMIQKKIRVPSIFTPDSNDKNSVFQVKDIPTGVLITNMQIFSRWGELVFAAKDNIGWNGYKNNEKEKELASDVYIYVIAYKILPEQSTNPDTIEPVILKGDVTLMK